MSDLDKAYNVEVDQITKNAWYDILNRFSDANIYQTWAYDAVRYGEKSVSHLILKRDNQIVSATQVRIIKIPFINAGIAYVLWGPMWRLKRIPEDKEVFRQTIRTLKNEFSCRRGYVLRIYPQAYRGQDECIEQMLVEEGYQLQSDLKTDRTLIINLEPSLDELRAALDQKWRNCLNRAEKNGLELIVGQDENLFDDVSQIYIEMSRRKGLVELDEINHLKKVQSDLPPEFKLKVIICRLKGDLCAAAIFSAIGNLGLYLSGATSNMGMKTNGSYIIQWSFLKWLNENGFRFYDLNGINPNTNPGTYRFKRGLAGKQGSEVELLGKFQVAGSQVSSHVVKWGEYLRDGYQRMAKAVRSLLNSPDKEV